MSNRRSRKRNRFSGPSLLVGVLLGWGSAAVVVLAPDFLPEQFTNLPQVSRDQDDVDVTFEFTDVLPQSEVPIDPGPYADPRATPNGLPEPPGGVAPGTAGPIYVQAASFRDAIEAEQLRAQLLLRGLPVNLQQVVLDDGEWHRVVVGPFESAMEANDMVNLLHQENLTAILINPT